MGTFFLLPAVFLILPFPITLQSDPVQIAMWFATLTPEADVTFWKVPPTNLNLETSYGKIKNKVFPFFLQLASIYKQRPNLSQPEKIDFREIERFGWEFLEEFLFTTPPTTPFKEEPPSGCQLMPSHIAIFEQFMFPLQNVNAPPTYLSKILKVKILKVNQNLFIYFILFLLTKTLFRSLQANISNHYCQHMK